MTNSQSGVMSLNRWRWLGVALLVWSIAAECRACSIPVFRYALERWQVDLFEVAVFYKGPLSDEDEKRIDALESLALKNGGTLSLEVTRCDLDRPLPADLKKLAESISIEKGPQVVLQAPPQTRDHTVYWRGSLAELPPKLLAETPAMTELTRRILSGDAVVWLFIRGRDDELANRAMKQLQAAVAKLPDELQLPPGIGAAGSELHSKIPLQLKFSVLEVAANDPQETLLLNTIRAHLPKSVTLEDSVAVPAFGRARLLEVFGAKDLDEELITEVSQFLCGACSCQVKESNPGFDLLTSTLWDERLFDEGDLPPLTTPAAPADGTAEVVAIPPGNTDRVAKSPDAPVPVPQRRPFEGSIPLSVVLGFLVLVVGVAAKSVLTRI